MLEIFNMEDLGECETEKFRLELLKIFKKCFEIQNQDAQAIVKRMTQKPFEIENLLWQRHYVMRDTSNEIITIVNYRIKLLNLPLGKEVLMLTPITLTDPEFWGQGTLSSITPRANLDAMKFKSENGYLTPMYLVGSFLSPITYHMVTKRWKTVYPSPKFPDLHCIPKEIRSIISVRTQQLSQNDHANISPFVTKAPLKTNAILNSRKTHGEHVDFFLMINPEYKKKGYRLIAVTEFSYDNLTVAGLRRMTMHSTL